jgi:uncharacterized membrane-anchored protein YitT (DUF2179 family)
MTRAVASGAFFEQITAKRIFLVVLGALLMSLNFKTLCVAAGIIPGGFSGLTFLISEIAKKFFNIQLPFSIIYYILNAIPVYISFRFIGKWFTIYSCLMVFLTGIFTDLIPESFVHYLNLHDFLLCAVFGGIVSAAATTLCLMADATSGGTDFIAIFFAERRGKDAWSIIFAANCVMLIIAAVLFSPEKALYSILYQFTTTMGLNSMYTGYQKKTLLIITDKYEDVYNLIKKKTNHDATLFTGIGMYKKTERALLYSVVSSQEVSALFTEIKKIDEQAFINVLKTDMLGGRFYRRPKQ